MVMWKPTGRIQRLAARSTPSVINPGRSKSPLLLSPKFSAQSELNDYAKAFEALLRHVLRDKMTPLYLEICFVTSYPRMTGLVNG